MALFLLVDTWIVYVLPVCHPVNEWFVNGFVTVGGSALEVKNVLIEMKMFNIDLLAMIKYIFKDARMCLMVLYIYNAIKLCFCFYYNFNFSKRIQNFMLFPWCTHIIVKWKKNCRKIDIWYIFFFFHNISLALPVLSLRSKGLPLIMLLSI